MQTDQTTFEKVAHRQRRPTVIVGVTDDKTGKHEKEIHRKVAMVECGDESIASSILHLCECKTFKHVVADHQQSSDTPQGIQQKIMGFGIHGYNSTI